MAIKRVSNPVSLVFNLTGGSAVTLDELAAAEVSEEKALQAFTPGTSQSSVLYAGEHTASITVQTANLVNWTALTIGALVDTVVLTAAAATDSAGTAAGDNIKRTMSKGVITGLTQPSLASGPSKAPVTAGVTISMHRHEGDTADPTFSAWTAVT